jgi:hypothetical protein
MISLQYYVVKKNLNYHIFIIIENLGIIETHNHDYELLEFYLVSFGIDKSK